MKKKILIVDDEPSIVRLLSKRLKVNGYETFVAEDSYQCIKRAQELNPDLILLDMKMPAGGGLVAFENLKASVYTSTIPVIFVTAQPEEEVKKQVMELGADGFIAKPFNGVDLLNTVKEIFAE